MEQPLGDLERRPEREPSWRNLGILGVTGLTVGALVLSVGALIGRAALPDGRLEASVHRPQPEGSATPPSLETLRFPKELRNSNQGARGQLLPELPAALVAVPRRAARLRKADQDSALAHAPQRQPAPQERARPGEDGKYTLHVMSYDAPRQARRFAAHLRARGHRAFITTAEVPGRGTRWRVRIGPFASRRETLEYRRRFERQEHMNTHVVIQRTRRKDSR